ncbi:MAG: rhomboid family intramembrane serine protease [Actinobacteria bacterium]|nr:MAG: rhomboid family intramembrane serine protease [Actinomycetota bacterium]
MNDAPSFGQRSDPLAAPPCPRHPSRRSVDYCKKCERPMCEECAIPTEVRAVCVDCTHNVRQPFRRISGASLTLAIIGVCVILQLLSFGLPTFAWFAYTPASAFSQPWRMLTTAFLHANIPHLLFNMLALYVVGQTIEGTLGRWRYAALYVLSALGGTTAILAWAWVAPDSFFTVTVGASGAVFGLFGSVFVIQKIAGVDTRSVLVLLAINLLYGFVVSNVSWQAHLGGLLVGLFTTWMFVRLGKPRAGITQAAQTRNQVLGTAGIFILLMLLQIGLYAPWTTSY